MLIKRTELFNILDVIKKLSNKHFDIQTQYKLLKIKRAAQEEQELYQEQIMDNCSQFFETDENGHIVINEEGGYKIKKGKITEFNRTLYKIQQINVQIPDIYFSIEELKVLNLTLEELDDFMSFIK